MDGFEKRDFLHFLERLDGRKEGFVQFYTLLAETGGRERASSTVLNGVKRRSLALRGVS